MKRLLLAIAMLVAATGSARAQDLKDRFNIRLIGQGMYATEQQAAIPGTGTEAQVASPYSLAYGDVRAIIDGRRLPGNFELHIDARVRITNQYSTDTMTQGTNQYVARGYDGGREYDLRNAFVRRRGETVDFALGRMYVTEADGLKLDGGRLWWRMAKHWDGSIYAGAYMDPFSRSLLDDYRGGFAFVGGVDTTYTYDKIWGAISVNSSYLGGNNDGGPLPASMTNPTTLADNVAGKPTTETPRTWLTWTDYVRLVSWLDIYTDLVLDLTGAAGVQLTRLDTLATVRAGKHITIHAGYDHLSAFAIEMWLTRFLADRVNHVPGTIENNLIVERTARDEVHGDIDVSFGKLSIFADGRYRKRAQVSLNDDPQFAPTGVQTAGNAYDVTLGLRERGSLWALRPSLWGTYLADYRSKSAILGIGLGRGFLDDRLDINLSFLYASTSDVLANNPTAAPSLCVTGPVNGVQTPIGLQSVVGLQNSCYGTRAGAEYEIGITATGQLGTHWFALVDYRLVADTSGGYMVAPTMTAAGIPQPTVLTHVLLLRIEARY